MAHNILIEREKLNWEGLYHMNHQRLKNFDEFESNCQFKNQIVPPKLSFSKLYYHIYRKINRTCLSIFPNGYYGVTKITTLFNFDLTIKKRLYQLIDMYAL